MTNPQHLFSSRPGIYHRVNNSRYYLKCASACGIWEVAAIPIFTQPGAFEPETIATMSEVLDAACEKAGDTDQPEVAREVIAGRIIAAAKLGERDPARLLEAALRGSG